MRLLDQARHLGRPAGADRRGDDGVFEDQAPADHPGEALADAVVAVGVRAAGLGHHRGHLGVGEGGHGAHGAGDGEGQQHARPGHPRADPDQGVDAGADDGPDPQRHKVRPGKGAAELAVAGVGLRRNGVDGLAPRDEAHGIPQTLRSQPHPVCAPKKGARGWDGGRRDRGADQSGALACCDRLGRGRRAALPAAMAELVDATVLGTVGQPWGFESL